MITIKISDNWEQLIDDNGIIIAEAHTLDVEDVLRGLKIPYKVEEVDDELLDN